MFLANSRDDAISRVVVVGTTGSGKTTFAQKLARNLAIPHIELDAIYWQKNWLPLETEVFRRRVTEAISCPAWVVDGNYSKVRDITWGHANTLVWLDYPLSLIFWRLWWRTLHRVATKQELWNQNRENWKNGFFSRESLFWWAIKTHRRRRTDYPRILDTPAYSHLHVLRFRQTKQAQSWMKSLSSSSSSEGRNK